MWRVLKYLFYLAVLVAIGIAGYAIFSELPAPTQEVVVPVTPSTE